VLYFAHILMCPIIASMGPTCTRWIIMKITKTKQYINTEVTLTNKQTSKRVRYFAHQETRPCNFHYIARSVALFTRFRFPWCLYTGLSLIIIDPQPYSFCGGRKRWTIAKNWIFHLQLVKLCCDVFRMNNFQRQILFGHVLRRYSEKVFEIDECQWRHNALNRECKSRKISYGIPDLSDNVNRVFAVLYVWDNRLRFWDIDIIQWTAAEI